MSTHKVDVARALKDPSYFNSLTEEEKGMVRAANPVGEPALNDKDLDSVSGGLEGGDLIASTTTTTELKVCTCSSAAPSTGLRTAAEGCTCSC